MTQHRWCALRRSTCAKELGGASWLLVFFCLLLLVSPPALAEDTKPSLDRLMDDLAAVHKFPEATIAPDGKRIVWVESYRGKDQSLATSMYVSDLASPQGPPRRITASDGVQGNHEHDAAWSPDGGQLAFL